MSNDKAKAEALLEEAKGQSRKDTEPTPEQESGSQSLEDAIYDAYNEIDSGEKYTNLTIRDEHLAALFIGLDEAGNLEDLAKDAAESLGKEIDNDATRTLALRLLVRVGLESVSPETLEAAKNANRAFLVDQAEDI